MTNVATARTSEGLRDTLFDALDKLSAKEITAQEAQAVGKLAAQIINSIGAEIEFYKAVTMRRASGESIPSTVLQLGHSV